MRPDVEEVKRVTEELYPQEDIRRSCLKVFFTSINQADVFGSKKWGVHFTGEKIRHLVGNLIVCTANQGALWMALDAEMLASGNNRRLLDEDEGWTWDLDDYPEYSQVPSVNGHYRPYLSGSETRSLVEDLHLAFVRKTADKYRKLRKDSRSKHDDGVIDYLNQELERFVPRPQFDDAQDLNDSPLRDLEALQAVDDNLRETERQVVRESRLGQGTFRRRLIQFWSECAVTGCGEITLLRASHIKPWRDSSNEERLDVYNGFLLLPNLDSAFDSGLISFQNNGKIIVSEKLPEEDREVLGICRDMEIDRICRYHVKYLEYHRENVFNQKQSAV
jgi:5-methylcytosine-specific restriction protein A